MKPESLIRFVHISSRLGPLLGIGVSLQMLAQPMSGTNSKALFQTYVSQLKDRLLDFQGYPVGTALQDNLVAQGVRFASLRSADGAAFVPPHNAVVGSFHGNQALVGTPYPGGGDDGQIAYEVRFTEPQRRAGVQRLWYNQYALTRFFAWNGSLLHQFSGPGFVAFNCIETDTNVWVGRIEVDGDVSQGVRQVGYADDLMYGTAPAPDPTPSLQLHFFAGVLLSGEAGRTYSVEFVDRAGDTNAWQSLTNLVLPASPHLFFDLGSTSSQHRFYRATLLP